MTSEDIKVGKTYYLPVKVIGVNGDVHLELEQVDSCEDTQYHHYTDPKNLIDPDELQISERKLDTLDERLNKTLAIIN